MKYTFLEINFQQSSNLTKTVLVSVEILMLSFLVLNMSSNGNSSNITLIHKFATKFLQHFSFIGTLSSLVIYDIIFNVSVGIKSERFDGCGF
jgi:hypothetical protein